VVKVTLFRVRWRACRHLPSGILLEGLPLHFQALSWRPVVSSDSLCTRREAEPDCFWSRDIDRDVFTCQLVERTRVSRYDLLEQENRVYDPRKGELMVLWRKNQNPSWMMPECSHWVIYIPATIVMTNEHSEAAGAAKNHKSTLSRHWKYICALLLVQISSLYLEMRMILVRIHYKILYMWSNICSDCWLEELEPLTLMCQWVGCFVTV